MRLPVFWLCIPFAHTGHGGWHRATSPGRRAVPTWLLELQLPQPASSQLNVSLLATKVAKETRGKREIAASGQIGQDRPSRLLARNIVEHQGFPDGSLPIAKAFFRPIFTEHNCVWLAQGSGSFTPKQLQIKHLHEIRLRHKGNLIIAHREFFQGSTTSRVRHSEGSSKVSLIRLFFELRDGVVLRLPLRALGCKG
ncbi:MAG: hypothetical protein IPM82_29255 [Saprospiraceae bacterium]|nr:hypothetical protein [Saprospiraceae bacterium]